MLTFFLFSQKIAPNFLQQDLFYFATITVTVIAVVTTEKYFILKSSIGFPPNSFFLAMTATIYPDQISLLIFIR